MSLIPVSSFRTWDISKKKLLSVSFECFCIFCQTNILLQGGRQEAVSCFDKCIFRSAQDTVVACPEPHLARSGRFNFSFYCLFDSNGVYRVNRTGEPGGLIETLIVRSKRRWRIHYNIIAIGTSPDKTDQIQNTMYCSL